MGQTYDSVYYNSSAEAEHYVNKWLQKHPDIKIKSHVSEDEIYDDFAKIYRRYRALNRQKVGDYFFKETEDLVNKLCDDFELTVRNTLS